MPMIRQWPVEAKKRLRDLFQTALIDDVPEDDDTRVSVISIGRYRNNPARARIVVEIHENDPDDTNWRHQVQTQSSNENNPKAYLGNVGRTTNYLWRRFVVKLTIMLRGTEMITADEIKGTIISRIEQVLLDNPRLGGLTDDMGEVAVHGYLYGEDNEDSGDDNKPIWRTKIWIQFETYRRNTG